MMRVLISNFVSTTNLLVSKMATVTSLAMASYNKEERLNGSPLFLTVPLSQSNHIINLSVLYKNRIRRVLFQSFRFNRILISISHIAGHADYDTSSDSSRVESSEFFRSARQVYRRNFDGPLLHSPFQTYCVRMRYKNSNILYCVWVTLLFESLRFLPSRPPLWWSPGLSVRKLKYIMQKMYAAIKEWKMDRIFSWNDPNWIVFKRKWSK